MKKGLASNLLTPFGLRKIIAFSCAMAFVINFAYAQNQTAKKTPNNIYFWEYLPPDYNSNTNNYPIVFFLHGLGERGDTEADLAAVLRNGPPKHVKNGYKFPFILISPQLKTTNGGWPAAYIDAVIEYCKTYLRIDRSRIYLTGLSLGGGGVWGYAQDPVLVQKLAAIAPVCGSSVNTTKACNLAATNLPVWAFHGDADKTVNVGKTINMVNAINACVPAPNPLALKTIYPGVGHNAWDRAYRTDHELHNPNVYEWLLQFRNGGIVLNAGPDITLNLPINSTTITATATAEGSTITSYTWTKVSGGAATITNGSTNTVSLTDLAEGVYTFRLTVRNSLGETAYDDVKITVLKSNVSPVANAGADVSLTLPTNAVTINGTGSDADGIIASYSWTKVSGPAATIAGATTATLSLTNLVQGTYVFSLTVTDNLGASGTDLVTIVVKPATANQPPVANAGPDKTINLPTNSINLTGTGSDPDGTVATYVWERASGPAATLTNATSPTVSLSDLVAGVYVFQLTVTDNLGAKGVDQVTVTVGAANQSPIVSAGADLTLTLPVNTAVINGTASDPDGSIATYAWTQASGPSTATLAGANSAVLTARNLVAGTYTFLITVTDDKGATALDEVHVVVNAAPVNIPPIAQAGGDKTVNLPTNNTNLNGSGSDADGTITVYSWEKLSGPAVTLGNTATATLLLSALEEGVYTFELTVTDNAGATDTDEVTVIVVAANQAPVASAGADITLTLPTNTTSLTGSGTDADGAIAQYEWRQVNGPGTATLINATSATATVNDLLEGSYTFRLTVTDDKGSSAFDDVVVVVNTAVANNPPVAHAGADKSITLPTNSITLNGTATDTDGTISSYAWSLVSGPPATLLNQNTAMLTANNLIAGTYIFRLSVTDDDGATDTDNVTVTVQPAAVNQSPVADAGNDVTLTLPDNSVTLTGAGTDADGTIASYGWTQVSGPATAPSGQNTNTLILTDLLEGVYVFALTVTDDKGATDSDEVTVSVNTGNVAPVAHAGADITISLPTDNAVIAGSGTDIDGNIASFEWTQEAGPNTAVLTDATTHTLTASGLVEGSYTFRLTVTDDDGETGTDEVKVIVNAANIAPTASAWPSKTITLPTNTVNFNGLGTDTDGTITAYLWSQVSGPSATLVNTTTQTLTVTVNAAGIYFFRLTVTDNGGATAYDDLKLTVNPATVNQPPVADAGTNKSITLPVNAINLTGTGADPDGSIASYKWIKVGGPTATLTNANTPTVSLSNLTEGTYVFRLTVTDNQGLSASAEVTVTVLPAVVNQIPVASAGADKTVTLPTSDLTLTGSGSDPDGTIAAYAWTQLSGPAPTMTNVNTASLVLSDLVDGTYVFRLTVTDDKGATDTDEVTVKVNPPVSNQPPIADAGANQTITLPVNALNLSGSGADADGSIASYEWVKVSGGIASLANTTTPTVSISALAQGTYVFRLTITDNGGLSAFDEVTVTVLPAAVNQIPVANAGTDKTITLPTNSITLFGSGSDPDGTVLTYSWTKISGPVVPITNENTPNLTLTDLVGGVYVFRLTVKDDKNATDTDDVRLTVNAVATNQPPLANAGPDKTVNLPTSIVTLNGSASDNDGAIVKYTWQKVSGPATSLGTTDIPALTVSNLTEGNYTFRLTVEDDDGATDSDEVMLTVLPAILNKAPLVDAGADIQIAEPSSAALIVATASDSDGLISKYVWTQVAGATATLSPSAASLNVTNLTVGVYRFRITVTDDKSATAFDEITVTVNAATANQPPTADAGDDIRIKLPNNTAQLTGAGTDPEGGVLTYSWIKTSGPAATESGVAPILNLTNLVEGVYTYLLTVTDDAGETATDAVEITVLPATLNEAPIANAGDDVTIELPENTTTLQGSATDDGTITAISWQKIAGPEITISGDNTYTPLLSDLVEGAYVFRLSVTDDAGLSSYDDVTVTVFAEPTVSDPPTVNAGEDVVIQLPENTATFTAIAEAPEGLIVSYEWVQTSGEPVTIVADTAFTLVLADLVAGTYTFAITVTDNNDVTATDEVQLVVLPEDPTAVKPHNLFSPDNKGDISTETWVIDNASMLDGCEIIVYNRQGQKVYSSLGYPTPWDGTFNGQPVPDGAYFYVIRCSGQQSQSGSVTIARMK